MLTTCWRAGTRRRCTSRRSCRWRSSTAGASATPGERLAVVIENRDADGALVFDAHLALRRRELTRGALTRVLVRRPAITLRVLGGIYGQALRLRLKGARWHPRPPRAPRSRRFARTRPLPPCRRMRPRRASGPPAMPSTRCSTACAAARSSSSRTALRARSAHPAVAPPLHARIEVRDPAFHTALLSGGAGAGRAYIDGLWACDDLVALVRIAARAMPRARPLARAAAAADGAVAARGVAPAGEHARSRARADRRPLRPRQRRSSRASSTRR